MFPDDLGPNLAIFLATYSALIPYLDRRFDGLDSRIDMLDCEAKCGKQTPRRRKLANKLKSHGVNLLIGVAVLTLASLLPGSKHETLKKVLVPPAEAMQAPDGGKTP